MMLYPIFFIGDNRIEVNILNAFENIALNIRAGLSEFFNQGFHFLAFGSTAFIVGNHAIFCESAGALYKLEVVVKFPINDGFLSDQVHGSNQLHIFKITAFKFGHHGLNLSAVKHAH